MKVVFMYRARVCVCVCRIKLKELFIILSPAGEYARVHYKLIPVKREKVSLFRVHLCTIKNKVHTRILAFDKIIQCGYGNFIWKFIFQYYI